MLIVAWRAMARRNRELVGDVAASRIRADRDHLTGLANRGPLTASLQDAITQPGPNAVLAIDLDRFKEVNDRRGHAAGDALLVGVARTLRSHTRATDTVARIGGDEFVVVLRNAPDPAVLAERLRSAISRVAQDQSPVAPTPPDGRMWPCPCGCRR